MRLYEIFKLSLDAMCINKGSVLGKICEMRVYYRKIGDWA